MAIERSTVSLAMQPGSGTAKHENRESNSFTNAKRIQESFTARVEQKALVWLAARMPSWVNSDHLTLMGFIAMCIAGGSYAIARANRAGLLLATFFLAVNWLGDSLDGTLARFRNRQRPRYGFYVDHISDTIGGLCLMGGLGVSGIVNWRIALGMFIAFLMLSIEVYLAAYTLATFRLSFGKFGPTEIRILLSLGNVAVWLSPGTRVWGWRVFDAGGVIAIAGMLLMLIVSTIHHTITLYRAEPLE